MYYDKDNGDGQNIGDADEYDAENVRRMQHKKTPCQVGNANSSRLLPFLSVASKSTLGSAASNARMCSNVTFDAFSSATALRM